MRPGLFRMRLASPRSWGLATVFSLLAQVAFAQQHFDTAQDGMRAFGQAVLTDDQAALTQMLGTDFRTIVPPVGDAARETFVRAWNVSHTVRTTNGQAFIVVGDNGWTLPVPLVKRATGWQFDTHAGLQEMRVRRIGRNELAAIQTLLAIRDAQDDYAETAHDGEKLHVYASKLASSPGKQDGLYWPTGPNEPPSPLGEAFSDASGPNQSADGYNGYRFKLLTAQGKHAQSGAMNYVVDGKLFGGFAVIAWPVRYGDTGVMTFMVNHLGVVYERNLGPQTATQASGTQTFDPAPGWRRVSP
ncbi:DUF2950 domain-containing protein [Cupriavidus pauculus]